MGLCLKEQIYRMSGLANKVFCGYRLPVALWTCKAKQLITSVTLPLWVELWSAANPPEHWISEWVLPKSLLTSISEQKFLVQSRAWKTRFLPSLRSWTCLQEPLSASGGSWQELWSGRLCPHLECRRVQRLPCFCRFLPLHFLPLPKCHFEGLTC